MQIIEYVLKLSKFYDPIDDIVSFFSFILKNGLINPAYICERKEKKEKHLVSGFLIGTFFDDPVDDPENMYSGSNRKLQKNEVRPHILALKTYPDCIQYSLDSDIPDNLRKKIVESSFQG